MLNHDAIGAWEDQFNLLFRNISDGVILVDRTGVLLRINPAAASMLRITPEDCQGKHVRAVFRDMPVLASLLSGEGETLRRIVLPAKRIALGIVLPQNDDEQNSRTVLLQDITERAELESRREQLVNTIGHDLRNPVSVIYGFAELLLASGPYTPEQEKLIRRISQTAQKLQHLAYSIVDLSWIDSGMPLESVPVAMDQLITKAVKQVNQKASDKRISIAVSIQHPMPVVMGDPLRLQQVVFNLLDNAIKYSEPEQPVAVHAFHDNGSVRCTVADRGIGIPENELDMIFGRLYRSERETIRNIPGGGIGLTMAQVIIQRHGGSIEASSTLGRGSTFMFTLPLAG